MTNLVNLALYQAGWFACVLGAAFYHPWLGSGIAMGLVCLHVVIAEDRSTQLRIMLSAGGLGFLIDTLLLNLGVFEFRAGMIVAWLPPLWMTVLWIQFATTFRYSLSWLHTNPLLSGAFGLIGAPIAFWAGERLGAIHFLAPRLFHFGILAIFWSIALPLLFGITTRFAKKHRRPAEYRLFS